MGNGWYRSGDLGQFDDEGYLMIVGRVKDLIIRGGQNISPVEIENLLSEHPAVAEVAVVGISDPIFGERACACIVTMPDHTITLDDVSSHLIARGVAKFKLPEAVVLFDELPKNAGEKIAKVKLRAIVEHQRADGTVTV
jgi:cyclohexanecarboxylate-CoA ligase